jgi:hypothetical protein
MGESAQPRVLAQSTASVLQRQHTQPKHSPTNYWLYGASSPLHLRSGWSHVHLVHGTAPARCITCPVNDVISLFVHPPMQAWDQRRINSRPAAAHPVRSCDQPIEEPPLVAHAAQSRVTCRLLPQRAAHHKLTATAVHTVPHRAPAHAVQQQLPPPYHRARESWEGTCQVTNRDPAGQSGRARGHTSRLRTTPSPARCQTVS